MSREWRATAPGRRSRLAVLAVVLVGAVSIATALGAVRVVTTGGVSMNPGYHEGDLVLVAPSDSYRIGQVVAYRDHVHDLVVLHRIVGGDQTGYLLQGDNNDSIDAIRPPHSDVLGRAVLHIPRAGAWLHRALGPIPLSLAALTLLTITGTATTRRRRRHTMSRHHARHGDSRAPLGAWPPRLRTAAAATAVVGILGAGLGALAWTTPPHRVVPSKEQTDRSMTFSYAATVRRSAAYDGTTVRSPLPVFRRLTNLVDVHFAYQGPPGSVTVVAELSTVSGWRSMVELSSPAAFTTNRYSGTLRLDLSTLERRAHAASAVTGLPADEITVTITPRVATTHGPTFAPSLALRVTPLQLALAGAPGSLVVQDVVRIGTPRRVPRTLTLLDRHLTVPAARSVAAALGFAALLGAAVLAVVARRTKPPNEAASIRRRYASLLMPVHPIAAVAGRPVVDVPTMAALAKLAEQYGLLILHWTRGEVETFVVQDEGATYRYRTGDRAPAPAGSTELPRGFVNLPTTGIVGVPNPRDRGQPWQTLQQLADRAAEDFALCAPRDGRPSR